MWLGDRIQELFEEALRELDRLMHLELERVGAEILRWIDDLLTRMPCDTCVEEFNRIVAKFAREQLFIDEPSCKAMIAWLEETNETAKRWAAGRAKTSVPSNPKPAGPIARSADERNFPDDLPSPFDPAFPQLRRAGNSIMQQSPPIEWLKRAAAMLESYHVPEDIAVGFLEWLSKEQSALALADSAQRPNAPSASTTMPGSAVDALQSDPRNIPIADGDRWVAEGRAAQTSDGLYIAMRELAHGIVVDYLLERYHKPESVEIIDIPRAAGGSRPIVDPALDAYRVIFVQPIGNAERLRNSGVNIDELLRAGRTTAAADALEKKYLAAQGSDDGVRNGTAPHLTYDQALSLYNAIKGPWRAASLGGDRPLTRTCLMRYVDKTGGTLQLTYAQLVSAGAEPQLTQQEEFNTDRMLSEGRNAIRDQATLGTGDVATAVHGATLDITLNYTRIRGSNMRGGATVMLSDTYDFDESTGQNVWFPHLSTLSSFPTDYVKDNWMWDLEQYGLAKRFAVLAQWRVTFAVTVDAADKPAGATTVKVVAE